MNARTTILALVIPMLCILSGCAGTARSRASAELKPIVSSGDIDFEVRRFTAWRRGAGYLQLDVDVQHDAADYQRNFERELQHAATLCAALANSDIAFNLEWWALKLVLIIHYGSEWRWVTTYSRTEVFISRETLLDLRQRGALADEYPEHWRISAVKTGPCSKHGYCELSSRWPDSTSAEEER